MAELARIKVEPREPLASEVSRRLIEYLMSGEVQFMFVDPGSGLAIAKEGKAKALAVTSAQRTSIAPGLPTVAESGVPGY